MPVPMLCVADIIVSATDITLALKLRMLHPPQNGDRWKNLNTHRDFHQCDTTQLNEDN